MIHSELDIVIPVYNEEKNLTSLVKRIDLALRKRVIRYRMIFVDDRSTDGTRELLNNLSITYPITLALKKGPQGKAYSILEGVELASSEYIVMIDGDLQYPPEAIGEMYSMRRDFGIVVANRQKFCAGGIRRWGSRLNNFLFGRLMLGHRCDVQSGLKLIRREIFRHLGREKITPWTIDLHLLSICQELGEEIGQVDIEFAKRSGGVSNVNFVKTGFEIAWSAIKLKLRGSRVLELAPTERTRMLGAGIAHRRKKYITHSTLPVKDSAWTTFTPWQLFFISWLVTMLVTGLFVDSIGTGVIVVGFLSIVYFADVLFTFFLTAKSLHSPPELSIENSEIECLQEDRLPTYSILCPLYREASVIEKFVENMRSIDWPKSKLEVLLLLEEDDDETKRKVESLDMPEFVRVISVPHSHPRTKPKACNYGLSFATGQYIVVYDAEDAPEPDQLKKVYLGFEKLSKNVICLQAKLNYYNPDQNLLTRLFTAEYSLWFDVMLPGLQSINTTIPLGGTSNHFRKKELISIHGWDAFNVTEDCDLGTRLFKAGYRTALIDSTTYEEANSDVGNWLRQRSRWLKGYMQTFLVHNRSLLELVKLTGLHAFVFQLIIGLRIIFMLINPLLWAATISYFVFYSIIGPTIESLYPAPIFYLAVVSLVLGNFLNLYNYMIGVAKRGYWGLVKYVYLVPLYWLLVSLAALKALFQLVTRPHYWEKTHHGLHLNPLNTSRLATRWAAGVTRILKDVGRLFDRGGVVVLAAVAANFLNFLYNAYLGRAQAIDLEEFGLLSLVSSFVGLMQLPLSALGRTVAHRSGYLLGKYGSPPRALWVRVMSIVFVPSFVISLGWLAGIPFLTHAFHTHRVFPFLILTPTFLLGACAAVTNSYLSGSHQFRTVASMVFVEAASKLMFASLLVTIGQARWVYAAIPMSALLAFTVGFVRAWKRKSVVALDTADIHMQLPRKFFVSSFLMKVSVVCFMSLDLVLAKHFLSPIQAGQYAVLSLVGKMVYFLGGLFTQLIDSHVSRLEGSGRNSRHVYVRLLVATGISVLGGFVILGGFGSVSVPLLFGVRALPIVELLPIYTLGIASLSVAGAIVSYHQARHEYHLSRISPIFSLLCIIGIILNHQSVGAIAYAVAFSAIAYLMATVLTLQLVRFTRKRFSNLRDFIGLFQPVGTQDNESQGRLRILIFNWRDTKHVWAGGAEAYLHEIAKQWKMWGHEVTIFTGNDGQSPREEVVEGLRIIRRGGFYTVYLWAFFYYLFRLRGKFDLIVDSTNGVPFFTPLYSRVPSVLVLHHVNQDVIFKKHLVFPLSAIASFVEGKLTPLVYRDCEVVTVSESSRVEIVRKGIANEDRITVISPGVSIGRIEESIKSHYPSFLYLGRLKAYKNVDILISAFARLASQYTNACLTIAGDGECRKTLELLANKLRVDDRVRFVGKVSDARRRSLMLRAWLFVQPSSIEGWGITVIEANRCGTPVIGSDVHGLRDSIVNRKTGILVPERDVYALYDAMKMLVSNHKLRRSLSSRSIEWSMRFTWEKSAIIFFSVFEKVLNRTKFSRMVFARRSVI